MSRRFVCILLTISLVCRALADRNEFASIVRTRNSLKAARPKSNDSLEESLDKQPRTTSHRLESDLRDNSSCCGPRYDSNSSTRPDARYNRIPVDSNRYSVKFGDRLPVDRYGWQTQGQPAGSSGSTGRPGAGFYDGSHAGERFGSRPSYTTDSPRKPNGYGNTGYGGYGFNRPSNYGGSIGYGISGSFDNGEEFGPGEPNYPEENAPSRPNIQTQKAVALKALAGVALIGAAAALATNPVLLPIGVVSGRKKRSSMKMSFSPACIARLTCEIEKDYWFNLRKGINFSKEKPALERRLVDRISNNIPNEEFANTRIRKLIKAATTVAASGKSCNVFTCTLVKATETERPVIFKF
ncbi:hypothetical protein WH47_08970 [Habropoda laboriosa]|uniref:Uncharacterized protein n=1 Tax=Habropoda laboriosa TaxID=597456 RepID=A0A0L7R6R1_9HYME|nr:hypothetical protein WH47_08970 [Habropoda laboriosa]